MDPREWTNRMEMLIKGVLPPAVRAKPPVGQIHGIEFMEEQG